MSFGSYLENAFKILRFDADAVASIRDDPESGSYALWVTFGFACLFGAVLALVFGFFGAVFSLFSTLPIVQYLAGAGAIVGFLAGFILVFIGSFIGAGILHLFAKLFKGDATIMQFYGVLMALNIVLVLLRIPITAVSFIPYAGVILAGLLGFAFGIYSIVLMVFIVRETYKFSTGRAVATVLIPFAIIFVICMVIFIGLFVAAFSANPALGFPDKCIMTAGFSCKESKAANGIVELVIKNDIGIDLQSVNVTLSSETQSCDLSGNEVASVGSLKSGESTKILTFRCADPAAFTGVDKFRGAIVVSYVRDQESVEHMAGGSITQTISQ